MADELFPTTINYQAVSDAALEPPRAVTPMTSPDLIASPVFAETERDAAWNAIESNWLYWDTLSLGLVRSLQRPRYAAAVGLEPPSEQPVEYAITPTGRVLAAPNRDPAPPMPPPVRATPARQSTISTGRLRPLPAVTRRPVVAEPPALTAAEESPERPSATSPVNQAFLQSLDGAGHKRPARRLLLPSQPQRPTPTLPPVQ